jgi:Ni/Co efflux regulator RcnB
VRGTAVGVLTCEAPSLALKELNIMKRLIASLAVVGLIATPALAATTAKPATTQAPAKPAKAKHKMAKKGVKTAKPAATGEKTSG